MTKRKIALETGEAIIELEKMRNLLKQGVSMIALPTVRRTIEYLKDLVNDLESFEEEGRLV